MQILPDDTIHMDPIYCETQLRSCAIVDFSVPRHYATARQNYLWKSVKTA